MNDIPKRTLIALLMAGLLPFGAAAQEIDRPDYLSYMPLEYPRLVQANPASVQLDLFGDASAPGYRDVDPKDGIDDERGRTLLALSVRFAPYLVQNTTALPMDFKRFWESMYFHAIGVKDTAALDLAPTIAVDLVRNGDSNVRHQFNFMLTLGFRVASGRTLPPNPETTVT